MDDYNDLGYDKYFRRRTNTRLTEQMPVTRATVDNLIDDIPADKIVGGSLESVDGKLVIDLEHGKLVYNDGVVDLLSLGGEDSNLIIKSSSDSTLVTTD